MNDDNYTLINELEISCTLINELEIRNAQLVMSNTQYRDDALEDEKLINALKIRIEENTDLMVKATARIEALEAALREIFEVGDGWDLNTEDNPVGTTGEGHARCREIARAALDKDEGK